VIKYLLNPGDEELSLCHSACMALRRSLFDFAIRKNCGAKMRPFHGIC
jgi:hypothetical protein